MKQLTARPRRPNGEREPTWEVAYLFPTQGDWSEEEYLALHGNRMVEFSEGVLEVLPVPTTSHQLLVTFLCGVLQAFVGTRDLGTALFAPLRVRLWREKFREPDVVFLLKKHAGRIKDEFWEGADLVMEVVRDDPDDRRRDLDTKRREYARAGIPENWIVDPRDEQILVLRLAGKRYVIHGEYGKGAIASSCVLSGFTVPVTAMLSRRIPKAAAKVSRKSKRRRPTE
jgi:Uma2 family endonuclease